MLLDTSFLVDLMRGDEDAVANARELEAEHVQQRLSGRLVNDGSAVDDFERLGVRIATYPISGRPPPS